MLLILTAFCTGLGGSRGADSHDEEDVESEGDPPTHGRGAQGVGGHASGVLHDMVGLKHMRLQVYIISTILSMQYFINIILYKPHDEWNLPGCLSGASLIQILDILA